MGIRKVIFALLCVIPPRQLFAQEGGAPLRDDDPAAIEEFTRRISGRDSPELIDNTDALLSLLGIRKEQIRLTDFLKNSVGLVDVDETAFIAALEDINASNAKAALDDMAAFCVDNQQRSLSMAQLAQRFSRMEFSQKARARQEAMSKLASTIGTANYNQLLLWAENEKEGVTLTEIDVMAHLQANHVDATQILSQMCSTPQ